MFKKIKLLIGIALIPTALFAMEETDKKSRYTAYYFKNTRYAQYHCDTATAKVLKRKGVMLNGQLSSCYHGTEECEGTNGGLFYVHGIAENYKGCEELTLKSVQDPDTNSPINYFVDYDGYVLAHPGNQRSLFYAGVIKLGCYHEDEPKSKEYVFDKHGQTFGNFTLQAIEYEDD